jgi:hypothetical protein
VPGDRGAHGTFDARARSTSVEWWLAKRRGTVLAFAGAALALLLASFGPLLATERTR